MRARCTCTTMAVPAVRSGQTIRMSVGLQWGRARGRISNRTVKKTPRNKKIYHEISYARDSSAPTRTRLRRHLTVLDGADHVYRRTVYPCSGVQRYFFSFFFSFFFPGPLTLAVDLRNVRQLFFSETKTPPETRTPPTVDGIDSNDRPNEVKKKSYRANILDFTIFFFLSLRNPL